MAKRDRGDDPLLDANDFVWVVGLSLLWLAPPFVAWSVLGLPWWAGLAIALLMGLATRPLYKRYIRQSEAKRPSNRL